MSRAGSGSAGSMLRLAFLVLEGYAYLFGTILVLAGVVGFFAWGVVARHPFVGLLGALIGLPAALVAGSAVRALFFRLPEPSGPAIAPADAPELAGLIEALRRSIGWAHANRGEAGLAVAGRNTSTADRTQHRVRATLAVSIPHDEPARSERAA